MTIRNERGDKMGKYDDIINLPHHVSTTRSRLSKEDRAAQFSPFSSLKGFDEMLHEEKTAEQVDECECLSCEEDME